MQVDAVSRVSCARAYGRLGRQDQAEWRFFCAIATHAHALRRRGIARGEPGLVEAEVGPRAVTELGVETSAVRRGEEPVAEAHPKKRLAVVG